MLKKFVNFWTYEEYIDKVMIVKLINYHTSEIYFYKNVEI